MKVKYKIGDYLYLARQTQDTENWLMKKIIIKSVTLQKDSIIYNGHRKIYDRFNCEEADLCPEFLQNDKESFVFKTYSEAAKFLKERIDTRFERKFEMAVEWGSK